MGLLEARGANLKQRALRQQSDSEPDGQDGDKTQDNLLALRFPRSETASAFRTSQPNVAVT
jgi:hypothetical protein